MHLKKSPDLQAKFQPCLNQCTFLESRFKYVQCFALQSWFDKYQPISFDLHYSEDGYTVCCPGYVWNDREKRCKR